MKLLADLDSAQLTLRAMNEDLLRATIAGSGDAGAMQELVDRQHERVMEIAQQLHEAFSSPPQAFDRPGRKRP
jgi:hypothetical protein